MRKLLGIVTLIPFMVIAQPDWREQPKYFATGLTIGYGLGGNVKPITLSFGLGIGKVAFDLSRGKTPDPVTIIYGSWMGSVFKTEYKKRRANRRKKR